MRKTFLMLLSLAVMVGFISCKMNNESKWVVSVDTNCYVHEELGSVLTELNIHSNQECDYYIMGFSPEPFCALHSSKSVLKSCVASDTSYLDINEPVGQVYVLNKESGDMWEYNVYFGVNNFEVSIFSSYEMMPVMLYVKEIEWDD